MALEDIYLFVANRVRLARKQASLTQEELGDHTGIGRTSIVNIEAGRQRVLLHHLAAISEVTNIEISCFLPVLNNESNIVQNQIVDRRERDKFLGTVEKTKKALWTALTQLDELTDM
jgi:transcriptional regulator with XRE-family HTH domain